MSFPNISSPLRTDHSFREMLDEDHHKETTPLEKLPLDLVEDIIIADSLHLCDLGKFLLSVKNVCDKLNFSASHY